MKRNEKPAKATKAEGREGGEVEQGKPSRNLQITRDESRTQHQQMADASLSPVVLATMAVKPWVEKTMGEVGVNEAATVLRERGAAVTAGDLDEAKRMLMAQASVLDALFNDMVRRAANTMKTTADGGWSFNPQTMEAVTRIAFKAQGQCRATLQTLGELVNPRSVAFIKQANLANGPQQVNNGAASAPRTGDGQSGTNKLLEANPSERLDFGAQAAPSGANQVLEAVGEVERAEDGGGKVSRLPQRA